MRKKSAVAAEFFRVFSFPLNQAYTSHSVLDTSLIKQRRRANGYPRKMVAEDLTPAVIYVTAGIQPDLTHHRFS